MLLFVENLFFSYTLGLIHNGEQIFTHTYPRDLAFAEGYKNLLERYNKHEKVDTILAINGPGPFMQIRGVSVFVNTWKAFAFPNINIFSIPAGIFLKCIFPSAEYFFLGAGNNEFFLFQHNTPKVYTKLPKSLFPKTIEGAMTHGGIARDSFFYGIDPKVKNNLITPLSHEKGIKKLLPIYQEYHVGSFSPEYGADPSIGGNVSSPIK
jgi:hypothetical protein